MTEAALEVDENMPPVDEVIEEVAETTEITESAPAIDTDTVAEPVVDKVQERINKITANKYAETRRADAAEAELKKLREGAAAPEAVEPKLEDFDYDETQFNVALVQYHSKKAVGEAVSSIKTEQKQTAEETRIAEVNAGFNAREIDFKASAPDYDKVIAELPVLPVDVFDAIMTHEKGPQLAHYLGKHLDVADNINLLKLGEISAQLATTKPIKAPSAAPEPINPVKPGGTLNKSQEDMSMAELYEQD